MPSPRKRLTTQKSATRSPIPARAQNQPKSIGNSNHHRASQRVENKPTSQKSIGNSRTLASFYTALPTSHPQNPTPSQINRHTLLLEIAVSHRKQRPHQILIATKTAVSRPRHRVTSSHSPLATRHFFCNSVPTKNLKGAGMNPGEYFLDEAAGPIPANAGRSHRARAREKYGRPPRSKSAAITIFSKRIAFLEFDRAAAYGMRLNIPAGTAVRFEPGEEKEMELTEFCRRRVIHGFNGLVEGELDAPGARERALQNAREHNFLSTRGKNNEPATSLAAPTPICTAPPKATASASPTPNSSSKSKKISRTTATKSHSAAAK